MVSATRRARRSSSSSSDDMLRCAVSEDSNDNICGVTHNVTLDDFVQSGAESFFEEVFLLGFGRATGVSFTSSSELSETRAFAGFRFSATEHKQFVSSCHRVTEMVYVPLGLRDQSMGFLMNMSSSSSSVMVMTAVAANVCELDGAEDEGA